MKKSIRIGDGVAEFFGTHDGNIKYLESLLKVQVHIDGENNLTIDGDDTNVELVERLVEDYAQLRSEGVKFANGDLKSIIRIISEKLIASCENIRDFQLAMPLFVLRCRTLGEGASVFRLRSLSKNFVNKARRLTGSNFGKFRQ